MITAQHNELLGEQPEAERGQRGNGNTYEEFVMLLGKSGKCLTEDQVKLISRYLPEFAHDYTSF